MDWMAVQRESLSKQPTANPDPTDPRKPIPAQPQRVGELFQYVIERPVSLPRQKSALFAIVDKQIEGHAVSIYNEQTQSKYPLLGLRLKNTSGLHLMQGPITVYTDGSYAGDARIADLQPGDRHRCGQHAVDRGHFQVLFTAQHGERLVGQHVDRRGAAADAQPVHHHPVAVGFPGQRKGAEAA